MLWQKSAIACLPVAKTSLKTVKNLLVTSLTPYTLQFHGCLRSILKKTACISFTTFNKLKHNIQNLNQK